MAKTEEKGFPLSENFLSLGLGILVVLVIGALIFNYIGSRQPQKDGEVVPAAEQAVEEQDQKSEPSLPTKHKVADGEDLWKISERYYKTGYNWVDIARENNLANPDLLLVDTELTIPDVEPKALPSTGEAAKDETPKPEILPATGADGGTQSITGDSYTVNEGDHLWVIAVRAYGDGYKWVDIANANNLGNPDLIYAGNVLKIPR